MLRCPVVAILDDAEADAVRTLKRQGEWRGRAWFERLVAEYHRVSQLLSLSGGKVRGKWPVRTATMAEVMLGARSAVDAEEQQVT